MENNLSVKVLEAYMDIDKIHDDIIKKIFNFITKANELVDLSDDMYQIERTIKLNKISLKGYILDSSCREIENITDNNYENLYNQIKNQLSNDYLNKNLIDDKSFNICVQIMNDIFNYYISGYPDIPEEYLYHDEG